MIDETSAAALQQTDLPGAQAQPEEAGADPEPLLRKKAFLERVLAQSGAKRRDVRPIVEATLKVLGEAIEAGESFSLAPLGRGRIARGAGAAGGATITLKLRRLAARDEKSRDDTLAEGSEDS